MSNLALLFKILYSLMVCQTLHKQAGILRSVHFKHREHSSSSTKQVNRVEFCRAATQLLIMQNHEGHARGRED